MDIPDCVYSFTYWEIFELLSVWSCWQIQLLQIFSHKSFCVHMFLFSWKITGSGMAGSCGSCKFNFLRNCQTSLQIGHAILHSNQKVWVSFFPHPCQNLEWSGFLILKCLILKCLKCCQWYHTVELFACLYYWCWFLYYLLLIYTYSWWTIQVFCPFKNEFQILKLFFNGFSYWILWAYYR